MSEQTDNSGSDVPQFRRALDGEVLKLLGAAGSITDMKESIKRIESSLAALTASMHADFARWADEARRDTEKAKGDARADAEKLSLRVGKLENSNTLLMWWLSGQTFLLGALAVAFLSRVMSKIP